MSKFKTKHFVYTAIILALGYKLFMSIKASSLMYYDLEFLLEGMKNTIKISFVSVFFGTIVGIFFG